MLTQLIKSLTSLFAFHRRKKVVLVWMESSSGRVNSSNYITAFAHSVHPPLLLLYSFALPLLIVYERRVLPSPVHSAAGHWDCGPDLTLEPVIRIT